MEERCFDAYPPYFWPQASMASTQTVLELQLSAGGLVTIAVGAGVTRGTPTSTGVATGTGVAASTAGMQGGAVGFKEGVHVS